MSYTSAGVPPVVGQPGPGLAWVPMEIKGSVDIVLPEALNWCIMYSVIESSMRVCCRGFSDPSRRKSDLEPARFGLKQ